MIDVKMKLKQRVTLVFLLALVVSSFLIIKMWVQPGDASPTATEISRSHHVPVVHSLTPGHEAHSPTPGHEAHSPTPGHGAHSPVDVNYMKYQQNMNDHRLLDVPSDIKGRDPWDIWKNWVKQDSFYPQGAFQSDEMNLILSAMVAVPITSFGLGHKGTQLKATAMLGQQRTVFKPKR